MWLFYTMPPEQMKSVHYISVWLTSQTSGTLHACFLAELTISELIFRVKKKYISRALDHSWYLDTHTFLMCILMHIFLFYISWFCGADLHFLKRLDFPGEAVDLLLKAWFTFSFVKQIWTIFVCLLARSFNFLRDFSFHVCGMICSSFANYSMFGKTTIFHAQLSFFFFFSKSQIDSLQIQNVPAL